MNAFTHKLSALLFREKVLIPLFFGAYLLLGLSIYPDYGVSWDEDAQRGHGLVSLDYVHKTLGTGAERIVPDQELATYDRRHYAVLFSIVCAQLDQWLQLYDYREQILLRHLLVFLQCWLGAVFFYLLLRKRFAGWGWALLGVTMLVLSPRIFAHSFYNPKDTIMLAWYAVGLFTLVRLLEKPSAGRAAWHALACAIAINVRITGVLLPVLTLGFLAFYLFLPRFEKGKVKGTLTAGGVYLVLTTGLTVLFWPYLWEAPLPRFLEAFSSMSQYEWAGEVRYYGENIYSLGVPWHYPMGYIFATTPPIYVILFLTGTGWVVIRQVRDLQQNRFFATLSARADLAALAFCFGPLLAVIFLNSTLYDGWRHLYFIYPPILYLALTALHAAYYGLRPLYRRIILALFIMDMVWTAFFMVRFHPFQNVYFNPMVGTGKIYRFEMDYWGNSYKQALEELLRRSPGKDPMVIYCSNYPCEMNLRFLPPEDRERFRIVWKREEARYYLSNYRNPRHDYLLKESRFPYDNELFSIEVLGEKIVGVYVLPDDQ